jgi:hypothetical protein
VKFLGQKWFAFSPDGVKILAIFLGKIVARAGIGLAKMPEIFASNLLFYLVN